MSDNNVNEPGFLVSKLDWQELENSVEDGSSMFTASTEIGEYHIWPVAGGGWAVTVPGTPGAAHDSALRLDDAFAFAQSNLERRVLSCLSPVAVEEADAKAVAPLGYLKPENDHTLEPRFIYANDRTEEWMSGVFTVPVYSTPSPQIGKAGAGPVRDATDAMIEAGLKVDMTNEDEVAFLHNVWHAMVAAHPAGAGPVGEAVAWRWRLRSEFNGEWGPGAWTTTTLFPDLHDPTRYEVEPLYACPAKELGEGVAFAEKIEQVEEENELLRRDRDAVEKMYHRTNSDLSETIVVLRPFADFAELIPQDDPDDKRIMSLQRARSDWVHITVGDLRMAAAAQFQRSERDKDDEYYRSVAEANDPNFGGWGQDDDLLQPAGRCREGCRSVYEPEMRERLEKARRAVQKLGGILSLKPHSREHDLSDRYLEWVQHVEKAHADIRDALDRAALPGDAQEAGR